MIHESDRNLVIVKDAHPVHYHETFLNDCKIAAGNVLKLTFKTAQFKILIFDYVSWMQHQLNVLMLANVDNNRF